VRLELRVPPALRVSKVLQDPQDPKAYRESRDLLVPRVKLGRPVLLVPRVYRVRLGLLVPPELRVQRDHREKLDLLDQPVLRGFKE
jgi:hypothetical protein